METKQNPGQEPKQEQPKQPKLNEAALKASKETKEKQINNNSIVTKNVKENCDTKQSEG